MNESPPQDNDPRVDLASYRTALALDRTTLAWVRTALGMASFGFGMVAFFRTMEEKNASPRAIKLHEGAIMVGTSLMILSLVATMLAGTSHWAALRKLHEGKPPVISRFPLSIILAMMFGIISLTALWAVFRS